MAKIEFSSTFPVAPALSAWTGTSRVVLRPGTKLPDSVVRKRTPGKPTEVRIVPDGRLTSFWVKLRKVTMPVALLRGTEISPVVSASRLSVLIKLSSYDGILPVIKTDLSAGSARIGRTTVWVLFSGLRMICARGIKREPIARIANTPIVKVRNRTAGFPRHAASWTRICARKARKSLRGARRSTFGPNPFSGQGSRCASPVE